MSLRVFLVDDERLARQAMRRLLSAHDHVEVVGEAVSANAALNQLKTIPADLVLLDVEMPGGSGFGVVTQLSGAADVNFVLAWGHDAAQGFEAVTPATSLFAAFPVAVVTGNSEKNGSLEVSAEYL